MRSLQLSGSYFDIGYNSGIALKGLGFVPRHANSVEVRFAHDCVKELKRSCPEMLEEMEGLGMALKCNYKDVLSMVLTDPALSEDHSTVFALGKDMASKRTAMLAGNYNRHYRHTGHPFRIRSSPKGAYSSIGNTDIPIGRHDGMNSKGLAISGSCVPGGQIKPGMAPSLLIRQALDRCATVDEAVELLSKAKHARQFNFVLADNAGRMALVEASPSSTNVKLYKEGVVVATNHFQSRKTMGGASTGNDTVSRHRRVRGLITGKVGEEGAFGVLSDHKGRICEHPGDSEFSTVWSSVFSTKDKTYSATEGNPCAAKRKTYRL